MFTVSQKDNGFEYRDYFNTLEMAINCADELLNEVPSDVHATFTVKDETGKLVASVTDRRIIGTFNKQQWGGRKGDDAIHFGEEQFDATEFVLLMNLDEMKLLQDDDDCTDAVGKEFVQWDGPHSVHIVDAILDFFGVVHLDDISEEALQFARNRPQKSATKDEVVTLSIKVKLRVAGNATVNEFIENLSYSVTSNTIGVTVNATEIVDAD